MDTSDVRERTEKVLQGQADDLRELREAFKGKILQLKDSASSEYLLHYAEALEIVVKSERQVLKDMDKIANGQYME